MRRDNAILRILSEHLRQGRRWIGPGLVFIFICFSAPAAASQVRVVQGQIVRLRLHNVLTTDNVVKGDSIDFDVAEDVVVATHVVIHKGDPARGKVVAVKGAGKRNVKDASVTFQFVSVRSVDSQEIQLRKTPEKPKRADSKENEIEANDALPGYAQRVIGADKGKEFVAYVDVSATVNAPDAPPPGAAGGNISTTATGGGSSTTTTAVSPPSALPASEEQATIDFNSNPPGADILIDGVLVGNTPTVLQVNPGHRRIQLRIGGYNSWARTMVVEPGSYPSIRATLEKQ